MSTFMKMVTIGLSDTQLQTAVGTPGSIIYNSTTGEMHLMDGVTPGGQSLATDDEVSGTLANVTASGGQILPTLGTPTTAGHVVVWDGNAWDESGDFALTVDVNQMFTDLSPATGNSTASQFLQWNNGKLVNTTVAGGGGGGVHAPTTSTGTNGVLQYDTTAADWVVSTAFALTADVTTDISNAITGLKGPTTTYNTLKLAEDAILNNNSRIASIQTLLGNKPDRPSRGPNSGEVLTWDNVNGVFDYSSAFATDAELTTKSNKPGASSLTDEVLAWDATANSGEGAFLQKDMSVYAKIGSATTFTDLGLIETDLMLKAPKPPNGIQAGEFLRWDETNQVFTFATPAGGGGGSSIPTPATTTDYTTAGAMQVLIWDSASGDLKNVASPFVEPPPASAAGEYLRWDATSGWINDTPAGGGGGSSFGTPSSGTLANEAVTWDGVSAFVNTAGYAMLTDLAGKADEPATYTGANEFLKWTSSGFSNAALSTVGISAGSFVSPVASTSAGEYVAWDGSKFENRTGFVDTATLNALHPNSSSASSATEVVKWDGVKFINQGIAPSASSGTNEVVKWNGSAFENVTFSSVGFTTTNFITPATSSATGEALKWDGSNFVQFGGFAMKPSASSNTNEFLQWDATANSGAGGFVQSAVSASSGTSVFTITDTGTEYLIEVDSSLAP